MNPIRRRFLVALAALVAAAAAPRPALSLDFHELGVVFVHGKGLWPSAFDGGLPDALRQAGAQVATPEMPWSFSRIYSGTFEQALIEIDAAVAELRAKGATKIVVIGHSLGANAAIAYAATRGPLTAVVVIAPGHLPDSDSMQALTSTARTEAAQLVANGQGNVRRRFPDLLQGIPTIVSATPLSYLSLFDPNGPAVMPKNAAAMPPIPILWVVGLFDAIYFRGRDYAFTLAAKNPQSRYVQVIATHLSAPLVAHNTIMRWLESL